MHTDHPSVGPAMPNPYLQANGALRNKLGLDHPRELTARERSNSLYGTVSIRAGDYPPFPHTAAGHREVHRVLFTATYAWAGRTRSVDLPPVTLADGREVPSVPHGQVPAALRHAFDQLGPALPRLAAEAAKPREDRDVDLASRVLAAHAATLAYVRPFYVGSGRALRQGLENVAAVAHLHIDQDPLRKADERERWREAVGRAVLDPRDLRPLREATAALLVPRERLAERLHETQARTRERQRQRVREQGYGLGD